MFPKVIVSLTTYPKRFGSIGQALQPILRQSVPPDEVQLWLAKDEFFFLKTSIEDKLEALVRSGVTIKWCDKNLKSHKKYYWAMQEHPEDIIITVDDDLVYPLTLVQTLLEAHYRWPKAIIASRTHMIKVDRGGNVAPYNDWLFEQHTSYNEERHDLLATSGAGALFPPRVFDAEAFDVDAIERYAPLADDLWLMVQAMRRGVPVVNTSANAHLTYIPESQDEGLYIENLEKGGNDLALRGLFYLYPKVEVALRAAAQNNEVSKPQAVDEAPGRWECLRTRVRKVRKNER